MAARSKNLLEKITSALPAGEFQRIAIKPNWVYHQTHEMFPVSALVTDTRLLDTVISACLERYHHVKSITVGDVPLQSCDFALLDKQASISVLRDKYSRLRSPKIEFLDLRKERWRLSGGYMELVNDLPGDPLGYALVNLNNDSMLEEVSSNAKRFRVSDYDPEETISAHSSGNHSYLIARSVLAADLVINMPKMKTHQKTGITGALKNLVGINGSKGYLVHHQMGKPSQGGDEFPEDVNAWFVLQTRVRSLLQKRSTFFFKPLKWGWEVVKRHKGIGTIGTRENLAGLFYIGSGSWYGNDSIWRMVYDLNRIVLLASSEGGRLRLSPQREYFCVLDGIVAGEGNGPLQPIPVQADVVLLGNNPFLIDLAMSKLMGYDYQKIPLLAKRARFAFEPWKDHDPHRFQVRFDEKMMDNGIDAIPIVHPFLPPPGWKNHIELHEEVRVHV